MKHLSTGEPSTLGSWRALSAQYFGENSAPTQWLDNLIAASSPDEQVDTYEGPMLHELGRLAAGKVHGRRFTDVLSGHQSEHDMLFVNEFARVASELTCDPEFAHLAHDKTDDELADTTAHIMACAHVRGFKLGAAVLARRRT